MADEQTTQTTQEQGGAQTAGGDPNVSTQSFAQNILGDVNPDGIVRKTGAQEAAKTFTLNSEFRCPLRLNTEPCKCQ